MMQGSSVMAAGGEAGAIRCGRSPGGAPASTGRTRRGPPGSLPNRRAARGTGLPVLLAVALLLGTRSADAADPTDRYWEWGWGTYGGGTLLDVARYDWSLVNFGNVPADERTVTRCNRILELNPAHKFVVRVWPIMSKGDCKENKHQATVFHYLYKEGVRERVLEETRRQIRLVVDGVTRPGSVVGLTFLEELPGHFTAGAFRRWRPGGELPWDIRRFIDPIRGELGGELDPAKPEHRLWWGRKYCEVLEQIHRTMKEAGEGRLVIYWQATGFSSLDHLAEGEDFLKPNVVPVSYRDIVKPGACDGLFGYPNNEKVWSRQTRAVVERLNCLFFSQVSTPAFMRLSRFDQTVELARWRHPGNLGAFVYMQAGRGVKTWNELPFLDGTRYWTIGDVSRRVAWEQRIGLGVVERNLVPAVDMDYDATNAKPGGFVHVYGQVTNPRDTSWFGGDGRAATLQEAELTLTVPEGFSLPPENSAPPTVTLGDIPPRQAMVADWWVRVDGDGSIPEGQRFSLRATARNAPPGDVSSAEADHPIPSLASRAIVRAGDTWIEPAYRLPAFHPAVELVPQGVDVVFPALESGGSSVVYRDVLHADERLVIGPGHRARLVTRPLFGEAVTSFAKEKANGQEALFSKGYPVYRSPAAKVRPSTRYRLRVVGRVADGATFNCVVMFFGRRGKETVQEGRPCLFNTLRREAGTVEAVVESPDLPEGTMTARVYFYCHERKGSLRLTGFDLSLADVPGDGLDVSDRLDGVLPRLERPVTTWTYRDRCDPARGGGPKLTLRFINPRG